MFNEKNAQEVTTENITTVLKEIWRSEGVSGETLGQFIFENQKGSSANSYLHYTLKRTTIPLNFILKFLSFFGKKYKVYIVRDY